MQKTRHETLTQAAIAETYGVAQSTVLRWRRIADFPHRSGLGWSAAKVGAWVSRRRREQEARHRRAEARRQGSEESRELRNRLLARKIELADVQNAAAKKRYENERATLLTLEEYKSDMAEAAALLGDGLNTLESETAQEIKDPRVLEIVSRVVGRIRRKVEEVTTKH